MLEVVHVSVSIARPVRDVYEFIRDGANLPRWASGLGSADVAVEASGDAWLASGPLGRIAIRFAPRNAFGVLDHEVTLPSNESVTNPMRVIANGAGATVMFSLVRRPGVTDDAFRADASTVQGDLDRLKALLEAAPG